MPEQTSVRGRLTSNLGRMLIGLAVIALLILLFVWWPRKGSAQYDVFAWTNAPGENQDQIGGEIHQFVNENFPPGEYEYVGIISQRLPTAGNNTTTTYVLFRKK